MLRAERTEQAHFHESDLFSFRRQVIDRFLYRIAHGAHRHNDFLRIRRAIIIKQFIIGADLFIYHIHIRFHDRRQTVIIWI